MTKTKITAIITAAVLVTGLFAFNPPEQVEADGDDLAGKLLGLPAAGMPLRGVGGGGAPWVVADSEVELDSNGELEVEVEGLLITGTGSSPPDGTTGPVTSIWASLTCEGGGVFTSTSGAPLNANGDAELETTIPIPPSCLGPIVLIRANTGMGPWIAASGF